MIFDVVLTFLTKTVVFLFDLSYNLITFKQTCGTKMIQSEIKKIQNCNVVKQKHDLIKNASGETKQFLNAVYNESVNRRLFNNVNRRLIGRLSHYDGDQTLANIMKTGVVNPSNECLPMLHWLADRKVPNLGVGSAVVLQLLGESNDLKQAVTYMGCSKLTDKLISTFNWDTAYAQLKIDGMYVEYNTKTQQFFTRNGTDITSKLTSFEKIEGDYKICGELIVFEDGKMMPRHQSNGVINGKTQPKANQQIKIICYDLITKEMYKDRLSKLKEITKNNNSFEVVETTVVKNLQQVMEIANNYIDQGLEGCVLKDGLSYYENKRSKSYIKVKSEKDADLRIVELVKGNPRGKHSRTFGSIKCTTEDGLVEVCVTGLPDKLRQRIFDNFDDYKGKIVEVVYNSVIKNNKNYSLFLPRFKVFDDELVIRNDKLTANVLEDL